MQCDSTNGEPSEERDIDDISVSRIVRKVWLSVFLWGIGTALGEVIQKYEFSFSNL